MDGFFQMYLSFKYGYFGYIHVRFRGYIFLLPIEGSQLYICRQKWPHVAGFELNVWNITQLSGGQKNSCYIRIIISHLEGSCHESICVMECHKGFVSIAQLLYTITMSRQALFLQETHRVGMSLDRKTYISRFCRLELFVIFD